MTRIIEHRSALPFGAVVEVHVQRDVNGETRVLTTVEVTTFGARLDPDVFPQPLPAADAFLQDSPMQSGPGSLPCGSMIPEAISRQTSDQRATQALLDGQTLRFRAATAASRNRKFGEAFRSPLRLNRSRRHRRKCGAVPWRSSLSLPIGP